MYGALGRQFLSVGGSVTYTEEMIGLDFPHTQEASSLENIVDIDVSGLGRRLNPCNVWGRSWGFSSFRCVPGLVWYTLFVTCIVMEMESRLHMAKHVC